MSKVIFITGAGSGLGRGAAVGLAQKGHRVIATTENTAQKTDLLREADELGLDMEIFKLDITNARDREQIAKYDIDVFVANAAINEGGPLGEVPMDRFRALFEVNVFATLETVQIAAGNMVKRGSGKIIFMSSMAGVTATPYVGPYTATKHAIEGIAQTLKSELETFGIQVATINPGAYNTGFNDRSAEEKWKWFDEEKNYTRKDHHLFRNMYPEETEKQLKETEQERWNMEI